MRRMASPNPLDPPPVLPTIVCIECPAVVRVDFVERDFAADELMLAVFCHGVPIVARLSFELVHMALHDGTRGGRITLDQLDVVTPDELEKHYERWETRAQEAAARAGAIQRVLRACAPATPATPIAPAAEVT